MKTGTAPSPNHLLGPVERAVLEQVIGLLPVRLTVDELCLWIAASPEDDGEVETIRDAIGNLRRSCVVRYRNDDLVVEPTRAAVHIHALLTP